MITKIYTQVLANNLLSDRAPTREEAARYVEMLDEALTETFPGAEVVIDLQRNCSGARASDDVEADGHEEERDGIDALRYISNKTWERWLDELD